MPTDISSIDMFMHIESSRGPITGEAIDATFKDHIQILSVGLGLKGPDLDADKGSEAGQCSFNDLVVTAATSAATPVLVSAAASGELFKTVTIVMRKAGTGQQPFMQWRLHQAQITAYTFGHGSEKPLDTITFKGSKLETIYFKQNADGSVDSAGRTAGWDADANKAMAPTLPYKPTKK